MVSKNLIDLRMEEVLNKGEKVLVGLVPYGDPNLEISSKLVDVYLESGVDIVEFALPSDDPFVDSKQIKDSGARALKAEPDILEYLKKIKEIRGKYPNEPFEVMAYSDALRKAGMEEFVAGMVDAQIDAHLLADSVYQEEAEIKKLDGLLYANGIYRIRFMPHPFREDLLEDIGKQEEGFMILQSLADENGDREKVAPENNALVQRVKATGTKAKVILAYGIRDGERTQEAVATGADGIIVGTSFVEFIGIEDYSGLSDRIKEIKSALK